MGAGAGSWYVSREEVERRSPSRRDGVGAAKEAELRSTYCSFIRDVGIRLQLPQVTIATAMVLCHRFYLRQSHAKNEWQTVATVCVFLASKIEDTPCSLQRVAIVTYETMYRKDRIAAHRIYRKEVLEKQKELILVGETLLLSTIRFDFNIQHPYEPLKLALKKLGVFQMELKQVAVNLINDSLRTTLVVQFKPHYIAAGSLYLAAKFNNVRLPCENGKDGKVWWHEFDVAPKQLEAVIQQMTELFMGRNPCSVGPAIRPPPTPTLMERQKIIRRSPTPTLMERQQIIRRSPTPTLMERQQIIRLLPTPTLMESQQITSCLDAVMRHTHSSRRSLSNNFDREARRRSTICSARNEGNQSLQMHMGHSNGSDARFEKQSSRGALKADHVYHVFSGPKDLNVTGIRDVLRQKRTFHDVGEHPAPIDNSDRGAWIRKQHGRNVIVVDTKSSSWKKQKL